MKINITTNPSGSILGYKNIFLSNNNFAKDIDSIINNCCEEIIFTSVDYIPYNETENIILKILSKLRIGGRIIVSGLNFDVLVRAGISGNISEQDFSQIIEDIKSIRSRITISTFLQKNGLFIESSVSKGHIYEISATRQ